MALNPSAAEFRPSMSANAREFRPAMNANAPRFVPRSQLTAHVDNTSDDEHIEEIIEQIALERFSPTQDTHKKTHVTMHYPSTLTPYFAMGGWNHDPKERKAEFKIFDQIQNGHFFDYTGTRPKLSSKLMLFRGSDKGSSSKPCISSVMWVQAQVADPKRLLHITCNSGKFVIHIPKKISREAAWEKFQGAHLSESLGYGMHCSTLANSEDGGTNNGIVVVFMEDSFDLEAIAKAGYAIFKTLYSFPEYEGHVVHYMTDRTTRNRYLRKGPEGEKEDLYHLSSRSYLQNPYKKNDLAVKPYQDYVDDMLHHLLPKARERQALLEGHQQRFGADYDPNETFWDYSNVASSEKETFFLNMRPIKFVPASKK